MDKEQEKRRAVLRIVLGNAQMLAAVVTLALLWQLGVSTLTVVAAAIAATLLVLSIVLFRFVWRY